MVIQGKKRCATNGYAELEKFNEGPEWLERIILEAKDHYGLLHSGVVVVNCCADQ